MSGAFGPATGGGGGSFNPAAPGPIGATTPSTGNFTNLTANPSGLILQNGNQKLAGIVGGLIDRFLFIDRRSTLFTSANITNPQNAFNDNSGQFAEVTAGTVGVITFAVQNPPHIYEGGQIYAVLGGVEAFKIEMLAGAASIGSASWVTISDTTLPAAVGLATQELMLAVPSAYFWVHQVRITLTPRAGVAARAPSISYFPVRTDDGERKHYVPLGDATAIDVYAPTFRVTNGSAVGELQPEGVIVKAFDGAGRYRIRVNNSGTISTISV
jgi:hypothetical protein